MGGCVAPDPECALTVKSNVRVTARFSRVRVPVAVAGIPKIGGGVTVQLPGEDYTFWGWDVTFMATLADGWRAGGWEGDGTGCSGLECVVTATTEAALLVTFRFASVAPTVRVEYKSEPSEGGALTADLPGVDFEFQGATVTFTAEPAAGWMVSLWEGGGAAGCSGLTCEVEADNDLYVTVRMARVRVPVTVAGIPTIGGSVTVQLPGEDYAFWGMDVTFTATPEAEWYVEEWSHADCANAGAAASPGDEKECILTATVNLSVTASFAIVREVVYGEGMSASLTADGGGTVSSGDTVADEATIAFYAAPPANHEITQWTNGEADVCEDLPNPCILAADADLNVSVQFALIPRTIIYAEFPSDKMGGTLTASIPSGEARPHGATVTFTATPAAEWYVEEWTGDDGNCANVGAATSPGDEKECILTATANLSVTAVFVFVREVVFGEGISASLTADGGGTVSSGDTVADEATIAFYAAPPANHEITQWTNGEANVCEDLPNPCILAADADLNVSVQFALIPRTIIYAEFPSDKMGGTLTASIPSGEARPHGATVTFTATPAAEWYVEEWTGDDGNCANVGAGASPGDEKECILTVTADLLVTAVFAVARDVVFEEGISASLTADGEGTVSSGDTVADGATIAFYAAPPENYEITQWTNGEAEVCEDLPNPCILAADVDLNVSVQFALIPRTIVYAEFPSDKIGGTLTASIPSGEARPHGATVTFTASPALGWYVEDWNHEDCANVGAAASPGDGKECILTANANLLVTATFAVAREVVFGGGISASLAAADGGGTVSSGDTVANGAMIEFHAAPPVSHEITGWTNNGADVCEELNPCILTADEDLDVRVEFSPILQTIIYTELPSGKTGGTLTASIPSGEATLRGTTVTFTATPASGGWYVEKWTGDDGNCAVSGEECELTANANLFVTVHFAQRQQNAVSLTYEAVPAEGGNVTVAGLTGGTVVGGAMVTFLATPAAGWYVENWNHKDCVNVGTAASPGDGKECILTANADLNVRVEFSPVLQTIIYTELPSGKIGGTLTASIPSGEATLHGTTVTFTATPAAGWYVEEWTGDNGNCAMSGEECELTADANLFVTVRFVETQTTASLTYAAVPAAGGNVTVMGLTGGTVVGGAMVTFLATPAAGWALVAWEGDGANGNCADELKCELTANRDLFVTVRFAMTTLVEYAVFPEDGRGGTLTVAGLAGEDFAYAGATLTFTATPAKGWTLAAWEGDVESCVAPALECELTTANVDLRVTARFAQDCAAENRQSGDSGACGDCLDTYEELSGAGSLCVKGEGDYYGNIPQDVLCRALRGDPEGAPLEGNGRVCSGVDANDTFCILDSVDGLPCRGLFRHVLRCNIEFNRLALNPFFCGKKCEDPEPPNAVGGECRP